MPPDTSLPMPSSVCPCTARQLRITTFCVGMLRLRPASLKPLLMVYVSSVWSSEQSSTRTRLQDSRSRPSVFGPVQTESTPRMTTSSHTLKCIVHAGEPRTLKPSSRTFRHWLKWITWGRPQPRWGFFMKLSCQ